MKFCSYDTRKVLDIFDISDRFLVEKALYRAYPKIFINTVNSKIKAGCELNKAVNAAAEMFMRGYCKNFSRKMCFNIDFEKFEFHYYYFTEVYLNSDFSYDSFCAMYDLSKFSINFIEKVANTIRVKNLWYLRKVLLSGQEENNIKMCTAAEIAAEEKGNFINTGFLNEYVNQ